MIEVRFLSRAQRDIIENIGSNYILIFGEENFLILMSKLTKVFIETLPILFGILLSYLFWKDNVLLFIIYLVLTLGLIYFHKDKTEFVIFAYGILIGVIVEVIGTQISGYQSFTKPNFGGIPMWLPIVWGYGFVAMKRIGFVIKDL